MEFLLSINKPHIGVFTAIDAVHSEQFGNPAEIAREEIKMVQNTKEVAFLNNDDPYAQQLIGTLGIDELSYQTLGHKSKAQLTFTDETLQIPENKEQKILTSLVAHLNHEKFPLQTNLIGKPNYGYLMVALVIAQILVLRHRGKALAMETFLAEPLIYQLQPGRCSIFAGKHDSVIIDSTYNASPLSMRKLIDTTLLIQKNMPEQRKVLLILGDMRELGDLTEQEHRLLAGYIQQSADFVVLLGKAMHEFMADELEKI